MELKFDRYDIIYWTVTHLFVHRRIFSFILYVLHLHLRRNNLVIINIIMFINFNFYFFAHINCFKHKESNLEIAVKKAE